MCTVEPLDNGHIGTDHILFRVKNAFQLYRLVHQKVLRKFIKSCPLFRASFIGGSVKKRDRVISLVSGIGDSTRAIQVSNGGLFWHVDSSLYAGCNYRTAGAYSNHHRTSYSTKGIHTCM